jgi:P4 family phage/plasmid primase-like protien
MTTDTNDIFQFTDDITRVKIQIDSSKQKLLNQLFLKSQSQTTQDVAKCFCFLFQNYLVNASSPNSKHSKWYQFINHRWFQVSESKIRGYVGHELLYQYLKLINYYNQQAQICGDEEESDRYLQKSKNLTDVTYKLRDFTFASKIIRESQTLLEDSKFESKLNTNPYLIGFENGIYDLKSHQLHDGKPEDMVSLSTGCRFRECSQLECQPVDQFMIQLFTDPDLKSYVMILLASILTGLNPHEKFHIWTGVGANGKSKLLELFEKSFGEYTGKLPAKVLTQTHSASSSSASPEIACLYGKRFVSTQEPDDCKNGELTLNTGIVKEMTGNDNITTRPLYGDPFVFKPQFKLVMALNRLPDLSADDEGIWRRINVIPFLSRFVDNPKNVGEFQKDEFLSQKFDSWREPLMFMLITIYYPLYQSTGQLIEPEIVKNAKLKYRKNVDDIQEFLNESVIQDTDPQQYVCLKQLWTSFKKYESGSKIKMKEFKDIVSKKLGVECPDRKRINGKIVRSPFIGWVFRIDETEEDDDD